MKHITLSLLLAFVVLFVNAQAIKITTYNAKYSKSEGGITQHDIGSVASTIAEPEFGGAHAYFNVNVINYKAVKAKYRLQFVVLDMKDGKGAIIQVQDLFIPTRNGFFYIPGEFTPGNYAAVIRDKDHPEDVYHTANFTITGRPKIDYKNNSTLQVCKSVDDAWNPIGLSTKFNAGECVNFLYKAKDRMNYITMLWNVVRVKADGTEEYVTHLNQGAGNKPFRWLATTEGICMFDQPGKYRVYLFEKDKWDNRHDEDSEFVGKAEFTIE